MLSLIGFFTILIIVILLMSGRVTPIVALVIVPIIGALIAGFGMIEIGEFFDKGILSVINVVILFFFSIFFFGIIQDVCLFTSFIDNYFSFCHEFIIDYIVIYINTLHIV